ncbi:snare-complex protein syntaxin-18 [Colletotrichum falcatum]|nr:snare-complex protein syntaxin-18 [Colletotrichum falcatum]
MDITPEFNELLRKRNAPIVSEKKLSLEAIDGFLKEAYRINHHITSLHNELRDVRQAYLSTAQPRKTHIRPGNNASQSRHLTDRDREEVDANAKQMLRELNASITALKDAELLRRETEAAVIRKKFARGLGALGAWAAGAATGGGGASEDSGKTAEHRAAEAKARTIEQHRDEVIQSLRQGLQLCGRTQQDMMEVRLTREMEKNRSVLAKAGGGSAMPELGGFYESMSKGAAAAKGPGKPGVRPDESGPYNPQEGLTEEQIQMFEKGNQDMLQHYNSTLDKVRTAEKSLLEIAELQTLLVGNLATQSAHIEQLVADSESITEDVGGGNKQLKKAAQRPSAARYTFFASAGLCTFLILWDLIV